MKPINLNGKYTMFLIISILVVGSLMISWPSELVFSALGDPPTISVDSPSENEWIESQPVKISGNYTAEKGLTTDDLQFTAFKKISETSKEVISTADWTISPPDADGKGTWSFTTNLEPNKYDLLIELDEKTDPILSSEASISFIVGTKPAITITSPKSNEWLPDLNVTATGDFTEKYVSSTSDLVFTAYEQSDANSPRVLISNSTDYPNDWVISLKDGIGAWSFSKQLPEGKRNLIFEIKEKDRPDFLNSAAICFYLGDRPFISEAKIILPDNTELNAEDLTSVPTQAIKIKITVVDNKPMNKLKNDIESKNYNPVKVMVGPTRQNWVIDKTSSVLGASVNTLILSPSEDLSPNSTYLVYIDQAVTDDDENSIFPEFFKFTTKSSANEKNNPHGNYVTNTNNNYEDRTYLCANCHSTHNGTNSSLEGGSYQKSSTQDPSKSYCMACHDGTMNAPIVDNIDKPHRHNTNTTNTANDDLKQTESCTSCHDPHLNWSELNPNMLRERTIFTSTIDSSKTLNDLDVKCNACHGENAVYNISEYKVTDHQTLSNKKTFTADGQLENYSLCLRCHNTKKNTEDPTITDIEKYYTQENSGHYLRLPAGKQTNYDGTTLQGPMPCAECHDTHGSNNIKMLREELGNVTISDPLKKFASVGTEWSATNERQFCVKCHNGSTEIYGKTGKAIYDDVTGLPLDPTKAGHSKTSVESCASCHGGQSKSFMEAAHAPKTGTP